MKVEEMEMRDGLSCPDGLEPTCPKCGHWNAMLHSYEDAESRGLRMWKDAVVYKCRDCGYVHVSEKPHETEEEEIVCVPYGMMPRKGE